MGNCPRCGKKVGIGSWPWCSNESPGGHGPLKSQSAQRFDPVVVFRKTDGTFTFPGRSNEPTPKGATRVELRTLSAVSKFEREMNAQLKGQHQEAAARQDAYYREQKRQGRESLRARLSTMSPAAHRLAEYAMRQSDQRESGSSRAARFDAGFHIQPFHLDQSNRQPWRDVDTGWKARRD